MLLRSKMFAVFFTFVLVTVYVTGEIPSYIQPCNVNQESKSYGQCIIDNIDRTKSHVCTGIPEFNISPIEPLEIDKLGIDKIVIYDTDNLKLHFEDTKLMGICDFDVTSFDINFEKLHFEIDILIKHLKINSLYDFDIHLLVKLANRGLLYATSDNITGRLVLDLKEITKKDKKQVYVSEIRVTLNFKDFDLDFDFENDKTLAQFYEVIKKTINENKQDIITKIQPISEKVISKLIIQFVNNVTYDRYEQLFPRMR